MQVPLLFAFVHIFFYWLNVFSNTSDDFIPAHATSMTSLCLCSSHRDMTEACVSSGSNIPSQTSSVLLFRVLISLRLEWDHFNLVQWPKEHHRQRGALCMRHPCDGIIWAHTAAKWRSAGSQRAAHSTVTANRSRKLCSSPSKSSHRSMKYKQIISHQSLWRQREVNAESSSSADYLALFS